MRCVWSSIDASSPVSARFEQVLTIATGDFSWESAFFTSTPHPPLSGEVRFLLEIASFCDFGSGRVTLAARFCRLFQALALVGPDHSDPASGHRPCPSPTRPGL